MADQHIQEQISLSVLVRDRNGILYEGPAKALSSINEKGPFDVLSLHQNFISLIIKEIVIHDLDGQSREIPAPGGVLMVRENRVEVYIGILHGLKV